MTSDLFTQLCAQLGYDPATVVVIRVRPDEASITWTEPSGMPRGRVHPLDEDVDRAA
jgi:hypothetical protein